MVDVEKYPSGVYTTKISEAIGFLLKTSIWPATFGLACCAIEMMASGTPTTTSRGSAGAVRRDPPPGRLHDRRRPGEPEVRPVVRQVYDQMTEPKWVISMGVCASSGGMFNNYAIVQGVDHIVPVDVYLPGCPPRPEMLLNASSRCTTRSMNTPYTPGKRKEWTRAAEEAALSATPLIDQKGLLA
jgi:NADH-quinone oxidoreductase subunit B